jgi:predicted HD superfamily hydrolase involved in NAD metabolism
VNLNAKTARPIDGIPGSLTLQNARAWALARVSKKRADHVVGVHKVGRDLAIMARLNADDQYIVELACLLHDACKEFKDTELVTMAEHYGMKLSPLEKANGHLLHGPVATFVLQEDLSVTNQKVLRGVAEHTLGNCPMSDISKLVFLADCLEESRPKDYTRPIWRALEGSAGEDDKNKKEAVSKAQVNLDNAMLVALDLGLAHLLESRRAIHPKTVDVRNYFLGIVRAVEK